MPPQKILFCTDFSENSEPARKLAMDYAEALGAKLLIVHVIDLSWAQGYGTWMGSEIALVLPLMEQSAAEQLATMAKECGETVGDVRTLCKVGSVPRKIVAFANEEDVGLIVIGTHGRTGVKDLVMGSVARSVLRMAHRPVLIVAAPSDRGEGVENLDEGLLPQP